jgi:hypothetical protein
LDLLGAGPDDAPVLAIDAQADKPIAGWKKCEAAMGHDVVPEPGRTVVDPPERVARTGDLPPAVRFGLRPAERFAANAIQQYQKRLDSRGAESGLLQLVQQRAVDGLELLGSAIP